jgi:sugar/nucleoside kinase (ribokinase family)
VAIVIGAAARLGEKCASIGSVGKDGFGECLLNRLKSDGVDIHMVRVIENETTGVAFVAYFSGGHRSFIYHWANSAAGSISLDGLDTAALRDVKWAHVTGCNIAVNARCRDAIYELLKRLPAKVKVSFDPNIRPEVLSVSEIRALCAPAMDRADIFFPSKGEAMMFAETESDEEGCRLLAKRGKLVVLKNGSEGCVVYKGDEKIQISAFHVEEIDPTGAGDSFCAGFISALNKGMDLRAAGEFANAVGALAVTKKGPMEGSADRTTVLEFIEKQRKII